MAMLPWRAGQLRTVPSAEAVRSIRPSGAYRTAVTCDDVGLTSSRDHVDVSNTSSVPSEPPTASSRPSGENDAAFAHDVNPVFSCWTTVGEAGFETSMIRARLSFVPTATECPSAAYTTKLTAELPSDIAVGGAPMSVARHIHNLPVSVLVPVTPAAASVAPSGLN